MAQVIEVYSEAGQLLGFIHQSEKFGHWRAVFLDGTIVYCQTEAEATASLREGRKV